ncbi:MAG TPA: efflux RND transporter periplasmic adaptor subunit [Rhizomicrobium sp.]|jgi:cobalt-zinc-cadmium efflux system membrane fusion protein|nr:efflux RND transporter periplasmic adaptor subunit [Rhizomicrobium sp.]
MIGRQTFARVRAGGFALAGIACLAACSPDDGGQAKSSAVPSNVTLTDAQRGHIHLFTIADAGFRKSVDTAGAVDFDNDQATSVLAPFSGPVVRLLVSPGEKVKKDQPLATVASPDFAAAVSAYRKAVATASAARRLADMDKDLLAHKGVSEREEDQAESDAVNAEADRAAALQALVALNIDSKTIAEIRHGRPPSRVEGVIRAPIEGTVVEKLITPGELLQAGTTPCFTVADLSRVWVLAQIFGSDLDTVHVGDSAKITTGFQTFDGRVDNIAAEVDPNTRSVTARVVVDNPAGLLKRQMYVHVQIAAHREHRGLLVPVSAVLRDDENLPFVYVMQPDRSFARRHVNLGERAGDDYAISAGLNSGERIVADGAIFLQFMQEQ